MKLVNTRAKLITLSLFALFNFSMSDAVKAEEVDIPLYYLGNKSEIDSETGEYLNKGKPKSEWTRKSWGIIKSVKYSKRKELVLTFSKTRDGELVKDNKLYIDFWTRHGAFVAKYAIEGKAISVVVDYPTRRSLRHTVASKNLYIVTEDGSFLKVREFVPNL